MTKIKTENAIVEIFEDHEIQVKPIIKGGYLLGFDNRNYIVATDHALFDLWLTGWSGQKFLCLTTTQARRFASKIVRRKKQ